MKSLMTAALLLATSPIAFAQQNFAEVQREACQGLRSSGSKEKVEVTWKNTYGDYTVKFQWIDFQGKPAPQLGTIQPKRTYTGTSYSGHIFVFYIMDGNNVEWAYPYMVPSGQPKITVNIGDVPGPLDIGNIENPPVKALGWFLYENDPSGMQKHEIQFVCQCSEFSGGGFGSSVDRHPGGTARVWMHTWKDRATRRTVSTEYLTEIGRSNQGIILQNPVNQVRYVLTAQRVQALQANGTVLWTASQ